LRLSALFGGVLVALFVAAHVRKRIGFRALNRGGVRVAKVVRVRGMDERRNERELREILTATIYAAEHADDLLRVCASVQDGGEALRSALMGEFGFSEIQAAAVIGMQVQRFTPYAVGQMREDLMRVEKRLSE
jgi:DNA gyrase/topoisomerase IV subunit A